MFGELNFRKLVRNSAKTFCIKGKKTIGVLLKRLERNKKSRFSKVNPSLNKELKLYWKKTFLQI